MIYLDKQFYYESGKKIYRFRNLENVEILKDVSFESNEMYEICMFYVLKECDNYYFFGSSRNGSWHGYKIYEKYAKKLCDMNLKEIISEFEILY
ncbi:MAG: hypothetical protein RR189_03115 [Bacilli bacterium]